MKNNPGKPFIFINSAMSLDGKISISKRIQVRISNELDMLRVDKLRAQSDAVVVGSNTAVIDDPKLTVKSEDLRRGRVEGGLPENPMKVMIGSIGGMKLNCDFLDFGNAKKMIFTTEREDPGKIKRIGEKAEVIICGKDRVDLKKMVGILAGTGVKKIMVEGGGTLNFGMLSGGLVNEVYVAVAPRIFGGKGAPTLVDGEGFDTSGIVDLELIDMEQLGDGEGGVIVLRYRTLG